MKKLYEISIGIILLILGLSMTICYSIYILVMGNPHIDIDSYEEHHMPPEVYETEEKFRGKA